MRRLPGLIGVITLLLLAMAWAPWLSADAAGQRATDAFQLNWTGVIDGCGLNCQGCGVTATERRLIGYAVTIEYACGLLPADRPEFHERDTFYVSPLGTVHGLYGP